MSHMATDSLVPSDRPSRRARQRASLTTEIKQIALRQIAQGGAAAVSWRAIAGEVGMNPASLYTYFGSLAELYTELITDSVTELARALTEAVDGAEPSSAERLRAWADAYRQWATAHADLFNLCFTDVIPGYEAPPGGPTVRAQTSMFVPLAQALGQPVTTVEDLAAVDPRDVTRGAAFWSAVHGVTALEVNHHINPRYVDVEAVVSRAVDAAVAGVRRPR
jgi:AcrR family transcriptional regulator